MDGDIVEGVKTQFINAEQRLERTNLNSSTCSELDVTKRIRKNEREKQRRGELNHRFNELCNLLSLHSRNTKTEKLTILVEAIVVIKNLRKENLDLKKSCLQRAFPTPHRASPGSIFSVSHGPYHLFILKPFHDLLCIASPRAHWRTLWILINPQILPEILPLISIPARFPQLSITYCILESFMKLQQFLSSPQQLTTFYVRSEIPARNWTKYRKLVFSGLETSHLARSAL